MTILIKELLDDAHVLDHVYAHIMENTQRTPFKHINNTSVALLFYTLFYCIKLHHMYIYPYYASIPRKPAVEGHVSQHSCTVQWTNRRLITAQLLILQFVNNSNINPCKLQLIKIVCVI